MPVLLCYRIAWRRAIRSSVEGCVEKSRSSDPPLNGLIMNMWAVAGEASMGSRFDQVSSFPNAEIRPCGVPVYFTDAASASNSRVREMAI